MCFISLASAGTYSSALAEGKHSKVYLSNQVAARALPREGAAGTIELHLRRYYSGSDSILFKNNYIGLGFADTLSPATNSIGAFAEFEPIAVFNLRVQVDHLQYFGAFVAMLEFPNADVDYSDSVLDDAQDDDDAVWATGTRLTLRPTFQIMIKRFVAVNTMNFQWYDMDTPDFFYQPSEDTLMENDEYFFSSQAIAGIITWKGGDESEQLILGARHYYFRVEGANRDRHELSGAAIWMMGKEKWFMENPMLVAAAGGYLKDRYRESDAFVGMMFTFEYKLWDNKSN